MSNIDHAIYYLETVGLQHDANAVRGLRARTTELGISVTTLTARNITLDSELELVRQLLADANAQLNAMRADRDRYKAWQDAVIDSPTMYPHLAAGKVIQLIVRPQPLKENE